jgi:hypothetical protein
LLVGNREPIRLHLGLVAAGLEVALGVGFHHFGIEREFKVGLLVTKVFH